MTRVEPAFSRPYVIEVLPEVGVKVKVEANASECAALAEADGIVAVKSLVAQFDLRPRRPSGIGVTGTVHAVVTQTCTVSLDPFDSEIEESVDLTFTTEEGVADWTVRHKARLKDEPGLADEDPPDTIVEGRIDLGHVAAEFLSLALDPYPRKPGVEFEPSPFVDDADPSPFAALAGLKKNTDGST